MSTAAAVLPHSRVVSTSSATITHVGPRRASTEPGKIANFAPRAPVYSRDRAVLHSQVREQPGEEGGVDLGPLGRRVVERHPDLARRVLELGDEVLPLADTQVVQKLGLAALADLRAREFAFQRAQVAPQVHVGKEVRRPIREAGVELVGLAALLGGALAWILDRQRGGDDGHLAGAAELVGLQHHATQARVDRKPREIAPERCERLRGRRIQRPQLVQQRDAVADLAAVGRLEKRERFDLPQPERGHLEDHAREVGAQDLRVGELRSRVEIVL